MAKPSVSGPGRASARQPRGKKAGTPNWTALERAILFSALGSGIPLRDIVGQAMALFGRPVTRAATISLIRRDAGLIAAWRQSRSARRRSGPPGEGGGD